MPNQDDLFSLFKNLSIENQALLESIIKVKQYKKNEFIVEAGQSAGNIYVMDEGISRNLIYKEGKEFTTHLNFKYDICFAMNSYIPDALSDENIQALTDAEISVFNLKEFDKIKSDNVELIAYENRLNELYILKLSKRLRDFQILDAKERYLQLLEKDPDIFKELSLTHIASFLGITLGSLSRIRGII